MKSHKFLFLTVAGTAIAGAAAAYFLFIPKGSDFGRLTKGRDFNVIIITLDTARADGLACYGCKDVETPTIDGFAARGIRFERCYAQTPLTLTSHTTLMTGTQPLFHGVRDNGGFLVPQKLVTMAELFKDKGYDTGAFIGAYVLDSRWGLNQGFDTYYDKFDLNKFQRISLESVQRPANEVLDEALPWLEKKKDKKFFTWIHLYDPHAPYEPPPPYDKQYASHPYLGEIAFADAELHRLWQFLETNKLLEKSLIVFYNHGAPNGAFPKPNSNENSEEVKTYAQDPGNERTTSKHPRFGRFPPSATNSFFTASTRCPRRNAFISASATPRFLIGRTKSFSCIHIGGWVGFWRIPRPLRGAFLFLFLPV